MDMNHGRITRRNVNIQEPEMIIFQYFMMPGLLADWYLAPAYNIQKHTNSKLYPIFFHTEIFELKGFNKLIRVL